MTTEGRERIIVGNWKMHKTGQEAAAFIEMLSPQVRDATDRVFLAVPFTALESATSASLGTSIVIGAQNMHDAPAGAFTGEISAQMLKAVGAKFVILGHSERRHLFGENDAFINRKVLRAFHEGLRPLLCIGEHLEQRQRGETHTVLSTQLDLGLADVSLQHLDALIIAYEPVWAIGTGQTATPGVAQIAHRFIRDHLAEKWGPKVADKIPILYGGSVKPTNATVLMAEKDIDGLLIGGAALEVESFSQIIHHHSLVSGS